MSFGDHMTHPKQLAVKFVQVGVTVASPDTISSLKFLFKVFEIAGQVFKLLLLFSNLDWPYSVEIGCPWKH